MSKALSVNCACSFSFSLPPAGIRSRPGPPTSTSEARKQRWPEIPSQRVEVSKRILLLTNKVPAESHRTGRTRLGAGVKNTYSPYKACRNSPLPLGRVKVQTEELDSIRRELSSIKAQVDSLLESLESMEQQRDQHTAQVKNQALDQYSQ
ncbi:uncharacterized protein LOC129686976 isoform X2 [Psammomys obesus]|uniref:uncharacterized protein LOC129686976 isoform X2 n=1 Tax=Psammomys obesus TaxID=48139 RepID=UPI0024536554|nr:uncharacterized protein LOC129686976 isoform X2 [Psammomys obesus]